MQAADHSKNLKKTLKYLPHIISIIRSDSEMARLLIYLGVYPTELAINEQKKLNKLKLRPK